MSDMNIIKTIFIKASPKEVFPYLVKSDLLAKWFHPAESDWAEGHPYALISTERPGEKILWGDVMVMQPPEHVVYTFTHPFLEGHVTTVNIVLEACAGGTKLTLVHEGLGDGPADAMGLLSNHDKGWDKHMGSLREIFADA
ncbi:MAG: activator of HSP90 ATPase [Robiginitomaculum sp.]|nr:MAG: activator of HSP90 ATPase [Robiginitomaculum sp.]